MVVAFVHSAVERVEFSVDVVTGEVSRVVFKLAVVAVVAIVMLTLVVDTNGVMVVVAFVNGKNWVVEVRFSAIVVEEFVKVLAFVEEVEAD